MRSLLLTLPTRRDRHCRPRRKPQERRASPPSRLATQKLDVFFDKGAERVPKQLRFSLISGSGSILSANDPWFPTGPWWFVDPIYSPIAGWCHLGADRIAGIQGVVSRQGMGWQRVSVIWNQTPSL